MTFYGLGAMFGGKSADMCAKKNSAHINRGLRGGSHMRKPMTEALHWPEQKFHNMPTFSVQGGPVHV